MYDKTDLNTKAQRLKSELIRKCWKTNCLKTFKTVFFSLCNKLCIIEVPIRKHLLPVVNVKKKHSGLLQCFSTHSYISECLKPMELRYIYDQTVLIKIERTEIHFQSWHF